MKGLAPACADPFSVRPFQKGLLRSVAPSVPRVSAPLRSVAPFRSSPSVRSPWLRSAPLRRSVPVCSVRPFVVASLRPSGFVFSFLFCQTVRKMSPERCPRQSRWSLPNAQHSAPGRQNDTRETRCDVSESSFSTSESLRGGSFWSSEDLSEPPLETPTSRRARPELPGSSKSSPYSSKGAILDACA